MVTGKMENGMERESIKVKMDSTMESGIWMKKMEKVSKKDLINILCIKGKIRI